MADSVKVIIIEDESDLLDTYADILVNAGYDVFKAADGYMGLEILASYKGEIKLVFLDLMMAGIDGLEVLRRMKAEKEKYGEPPVVVLTNMTSERVIKEAFMIGAKSYLIKSELDADDVVNEAREVMESAHK